MSNRAAVYAYGASLLGVFSSLVNSIWVFGLVVKEVDEKSLGIFVLVTTTAGYLGLLQLSLDYASGQQIASLLAVGDQQSAARTIRQTRWINYVLGIAIFSLTLVAVGIAWWLRGDTVHGMLLTQLLGIVGGSQVVACLNRPVIAGLTGAHRLAIVQLVRIGATFLTAILAYCLFLGGMGILSLAIADLCAQMVTWLLLESVFARTCRWNAIEVSQSRFGLRRLVSFGAGVSLVSILNYAYLNCDPWLLQCVLGSESVIAAYFIWQKIPQLVYSTGWMLFAAASPAVASAFAESRTVGLRTFDRVGNAMIGIALAGMIGTGVWLTSFINHWMDGKYDLEHARGIALCMSSAVCARCILAGLSISFYSTNRLRFIAMVHVVQLAVKLVLGGLLIPFWPLLGLALADSLASTFAVSLLTFQLVRSGEWTASAALRMALAFGLSVTAIYPISGVVGMPGFGQFALGVCLTAMLLAVGLLGWMLYTRVVERRFSLRFVGLG